MDQRRLRSWDLLIVVVNFVILISGLWVPPQQYAGPWLRAFPDQIGELVGAMFSIGLLPAAVTYAALPFVSANIKHAMSLGAVLIVMHVFVIPFITFARSTGVYMTPVRTLMQHAITVLFASAVLLLLLGVLPTFLKRLIQGTRR